MLTQRKNSSTAHSATSPLIRARLANCPAPSNSSCAAMRRADLQSLQQQIPNHSTDRYNYSDDFKRINVCRSGRAALPADLGQAYQTRIPISEAKKKDLVKLCTQLVIPPEMHEWYKSLPTTSRTKDRLPEPAVGDSADDDDDSA